ncbi:putative mfs transporter protein [Botrytis fragariae]|uniref:Putative mfs transporter protein n=1 Tax=Botrytis fragariae TaxID=1964551 RepID=A0A8H6AYU3_9HELO|nr:putative mfs transporter protein [Botrytis fragariae]KAF5875975.1 putative mfs transporter protein [Botrytis fragariae]
MEDRRDSELKCDISSPERNNNTNEKEASQRLLSDQPTEQPRLFLLDDHEDYAQRPSRLILVPLTFALMISTFMIALDTNIIGHPILPITLSLLMDSDSQDSHSVPWPQRNWLVWFGLPFSIIFFQFTYGRFYTQFNVKWLFISALVTFEAGSTICATATSSKVMIIGRAISGIGASDIFFGGLTISHGRLCVALEWN